MATLIINVPDESMVAKVKQACKMLVGVASVKVKKEKVKPKDVTQTAGFREAIKDVEQGRVTTYNNLNDFYKEMGI